MAVRWVVYLAVLMAVMMALMTADLMVWRTAE